MALHKKTVVSVDLPNGQQAELPSYCADAHNVEIVSVPGKNGNEYVVGVVVNDPDSSGVDPRDNDGFGDFKEFRNSDELQEFAETFLQENPDQLAFVVDKYEHGLVKYVALDEMLTAEARGDGIFIPCEDVQDRYKARLAEGIPATQARDEALADTNRGLDEFSDWCNGAVYGVLDYRFDSDGQQLDGGEECWGMIGSEYADQELGMRLFDARVQAKAADLGLDADKRQIPLPQGGPYIGQILDAEKTNGIVIQSTGQGKWIAHSLEKTATLPEVGTVAEFKYRNGAVLSANKDQSLSAERGR